MSQGTGLLNGEANVEALHNEPQDMKCGKPDSREKEELAESTLLGSDSSSGEDRFFGIQFP